MKNPVLTILQKRTMRFAKHMDDFCEPRGIKRTIKNYLTYKSESKYLLPDSFSNINRQTIPLMLFSNSKDFVDFWSSLDDDIKRSIIDKKEMIRNQAFVLADDDVRFFVKKILKKDYLYGGQK